MARGSLIIVSGQPQGKFKAGLLGDSSVPGTIMQVKVGLAASANGQFTWIACNTGLAGDSVVPSVLLGDQRDGLLSTTTPGNGTTIWMYVPIAGEEMNVLVGVAGGTANYLTIGERLMINGSSGVLILATGTIMQWIVLELVSGVASSNLTWCMKG